MYHFSQIHDQEVTSGNILCAQYNKHKSDSLQYPLQIPATEIEVAYLKLLVMKLLMIIN